MEIAQVQKAMPLCTCCGDVSLLVQKRGKRDEAEGNGQLTRYWRRRLLAPQPSNTTFVPYAIVPRKIRKILTTFGYQECFRIAT
jgi:hypothetical protein